VRTIIKIKAQKQYFDCIMRAFRILLFHNCRVFFFGETRAKPPFNKHTPKSQNIRGNTVYKRTVK